LVGDSEKKKHRLVKWSVFCTPKDQGGLGIHVLQVKITALLGKWLFKLLTEDGAWQNLLKQKYIAQMHYHKFIGNLVICIF
jgi:hypothetical protein